MKKIYICYLLLNLFVNVRAEGDEKEPIEAKHSNIHLQKITNQSDQPVFLAIERAHLMPLDEPIDMSGSIMSDKDIEIRDHLGEVHAVMLPVWQKTFRGNTINIVTLSGRPGIIWYLYVINDSLWAIKAPNEEGELKGVKLLDPAEDNRIIELIVKNRNVLEVNVLETKKEL